MADFKQSNNSVSTFATFLLVIYFIFSSHVDAEVDLLVDPTLIGQELQSFAKDALGVDEMQKHFEGLRYHDQHISGDNIVDLAAKLRRRFTRRFDIARRLQKAVEESYSTSVTTAPQKECCQVNKSTLEYDARFRSKVDLNNLCLKISSHAPENHGYLGDKFFKETKAISEEHPYVKWQYFGSEEGVMTNFPTYDDTEPCERYDPRYRPFYVETATPEAKDVVLVMDTSWSMNGDKIKVAREAAKTVLDTMNPKDQVGIVSFIDDVNTPQVVNCYSKQLALAIPANIRNLKDFVDEQHASNGETKFIPAFQTAFDLLIGSVSKNSSSAKSKKRVILFLTDGDPTDSRTSLFEVIRNRNLELNNSVIILTYGFDRAYEEILIDIANQNTTKYGIPANTSVGNITRGSYTFVEDIRTLRSKMATYYALFAQQLSEPVVSVPYVDAFGTGLLVSVTLPCYHQGKFIGVTGTDINIEDLMPDILEYIKQGRTTYAFMISTSGRTLIHPLLPAPADAYGYPIYMDIRNLEQPESDFKAIFDSMIRGETGSKSLVATRYLPRGGNITEGVTETHINSTYYWRALQDTKFFLGVVIPVSMKKEVLDTLTIPANYTFTYHRIDLAPSQKTCLNFERLATKDTTVVKFAPDAFQDPYEYFGTDETEASVQLLSNYMMGRAGSERYSKLRGGIRDTVIGTWKAEDLWLNGKTELTQYVISRYIGTADGVFRKYPGDVMSRGYDPRRRPWYYAALRHSGFLSLTTPYLDATGAGVVITAVRALYRGEPSRIHQTNDEVVGVIGADFPLTYFYRLLAENYPKCEEKETYSCFVIDSAGFLVMHEGFLYPSATRQVIERVHIAEKERHIADDMIIKGYLVKKECRNLEDIEQQAFYEVNLPESGKVDAADNAGSCSKYQIGKIAGTNVYLGISLRDPDCSRDRSCTCDEQCRFLSCKCPCISSLDFHYCRGEFSNSSLPICPALAPDQSEVLPPRKECSELEKCFDPHCKEKSRQQTCDGLVSCYWCERDKDDATLANPYCGSYEHCFRGKETPAINDDKLICSQTSPSTSSPERGGLSVGAIVGICIACIIILAVGVAAVFWGKRYYGMPKNSEDDSPMSHDNPVHQYAEIQENKKESDPSTTDDVSSIPNPPESHDQLPSLPVKRKVSQANSAPPVPATRRPSGAIETLVMEVFQFDDPQNHRKASVDDADSPKWLQRRGSTPPLLPRAKRPSELGDPSIPFPKASTPRAMYPSRVYGNIQSEVGDLLSRLPETDFPEQRGRTYGNVQPAVAKIPVESHDEVTDDITDKNVYLEFSNTGETPVEAQLT